MKTRRAAATLRPAEAFRRVALRWIGCALIGTHILSSRTSANDEVPPAESGATAVLLRAVERDWNKDEIGIGLAALGEGAIPELFGLLAGGKLPTPPGGTRPLALREERAILNAFARLPKRHLRRHLEAVAESDYELPERRAAVRVFGVAGTQRDFELLLRLVAPTAGRDFVESPLREAFQESLALYLTRDPRGTQLVAATFARIHPTLLACVLRAMGRESTPELLGILVDLLGEVPDVDPLLLSEIGRHGAVVPHPIDPFIRGSVRRYLHGSNLQLVIEGTMTCAKLEDHEAVPELVQLLDHPIPPVRTNAARALRELTKENLPDQAERWETWHEEQITWWNEEAQDLVATLRLGEPAKISGAIRKLSTRTFFRHELVRPLADCLEREELGLVCTAANSLGSLGSPLAVPHLMSLLEHEDEGCRKAGWRALRKITGRNLPINRAAWHEFGS